MKFNVVQIYKDAPPTGKILIIVGGIAAGVVTYIAVSQIIHSIKAKALEQKAMAEVVGFNNDLNSLNKSGILPTYQESQYKQWADSIQQQFDGCDTSSYSFSNDFSWISNDLHTALTNANNSSNYSDSGATVLLIIQQLKNNADFLALQVAFGSRTYGSCGILGTWFAGTVGPVTLSAAMRDELNTSEIAGLNMVLQSLGISYSF